MTQAVRRSNAGGGGGGGAGGGVGGGSFNSKPGAVAVEGAGSAPVAIPGAAPGTSPKAHLEASSWRGGNGSVGNGSVPSSFERGFRSRGTPESTPPLEGFMKRRTPQLGAQGVGGGRDGGVEAQPGIVVHFTIPKAEAAVLERRALVQPVRGILDAACAAYGHMFLVPPHQPPLNGAKSNGLGGEDDLMGGFSLTNELTPDENECRVTLVLHCPTWTAAEGGIAALRSTPLCYPFTVTALSAPKESTHSTLVVKNLPFNLRHEALMEELERMACRPTYVRYYSDDRGVFKGIAFVKYPSRAEAELARFQIAQLEMQGRKVRVEFKHKQTSRPGETHGRGVALEHSDGRSPKQSPMVGPMSGEDPRVAYTAHDDGAEPGEDELALEEVVQDFLRSDQRELHVPRTARGHQHIRRVCYRNHLRWDHHKDHTVVKKTGSTPVLHGRGGGATPSSRPLKAMATPPFAPLSNGSFGGSFGHGERTGKLAVKHEDVVHCKGPGEGDKGFPAGRGRPVR